MATASSKPAPTSLVRDADADTISPAGVTSNTIPPATVLADKAAQFISQHGEVAFSYEDERAVLRRVDLRILPLLLGAYFFQQLDKSSLSYVSIFGIIDDAHLTSRKILHGFLIPLVAYVCFLTGLPSVNVEEYSWLGSILYFGQLAFQPLAAFLLVRLPTGKVIGTAIVLWVRLLRLLFSLQEQHKLLTYA